MSENQLSLITDAEETGDISEKYRSYLPSVFITASLPLRDVKQAMFKRKYNNIELYLTGAPKVPYGKYARLLLSVLTTHAVVSCKESPVIEYKNIKQLLDELQLPQPRGKDIREQLDLFSVTSFQYREKVMKKVHGNLFEEDYEGDYVATWNNHGNISFIKKIQWIDMEKIETGEKRSYEFRIELSSEFIEMCREHSVPIDYSVYSKINSALGKDLYAWFIYRNNFIKEGEELYVSRDNLLDQFMPVSPNSKDIMTQKSVNYSNIIDRVREIKEKYYPELNVTVCKSGGIVMKKSPQVISEKDRRYILITS